MLPSDPKLAGEALLRWTAGDVNAAEFLQQIAAIARLADDIVDTDVHRQRNVSWLLVRVLTVLPMNPFFILHAVELRPLLMTIIVQWNQSDEFRRSPDALKQTHGFVMREAVGNLVTAVAALIGGYEHARLVADDFFETCHAGSSETVADWIGE